MMARPSSAVVAEGLRANDGTVEKDMRSRPMKLNASESGGDDHRVLAVTA